jgi:hypothetical protein
VQRCPMSSSTVGNLTGPIRGGGSDGCIRHEFGLSRRTAWFHSCHLSYLSNFDQTAIPLIGIMSLTF